MHAHRTPSLRHIGAMTAVLLALAGSAGAAVPGTMAVSGALQGAGGGAVADGDYTLRFSLHDAKTAGKELWSEGLAIVAVQGGAFRHVLGQSQTLPAAIFGAATPVWLEVQVGKDPALTRRALHAVALALHAGAAADLQCSGCVGAQQLAPDAVSADKAAFPWAGSKTKGGPATNALDLQCTGCVSVAELALDGDLDLAGNGLKAKNIATDKLLAGAVVASSLEGDGSKLTGLKIPTGTCKAGLLVAGIAADGALICSAAASLPADGLAQVSNGLLTNQFVQAFASAKTPFGIADNNPTGVSDEITLPDVGKVQKLTVFVQLNSSDVNQLRILLYDAANGEHVLYDKGKSGPNLEGAWPAPDAPVSGDLGKWIGVSPKGKWRLKVVDGTFTNNGSDGQVLAWRIEVQTLSSTKVAATGAAETKGMLTTSGGLTLQLAAKHPSACDASELGRVYFNSASKTLFVCNGEAWFPISVAAPGGKDNPALSCKAALAGNPGAKDGPYWVDPDGAGGQPPLQVWCNMSVDGGGWTLVAYAGKIKGSKAATIGGNKFQMLFDNFGTYDADAPSTRTAFSRLATFAPLLKADSRFLARRTTLPNKQLIWPVADAKSWLVDRKLPVVKFLRMTQDGKTYFDRTNNLSIFEPGVAPKYTGYNWNTAANENCDNCGRSFSTALNHRSLLYWEILDAGYSASQWFHGSPLSLADSKSAENGVQDIEIYVREP